MRWRKAAETLVRPGRDGDRRRAEDVSGPQLAVEVDQRHPLAVDGDLDLLAVGRDVVAEEGADAGEVERQAEDVVPIGREVVAHGDAAARPERRPRHVAHLGERLRHHVGRDRRGRIGIADGQPRDAACRGQVAVDQRRRHGEDVRHVVVALAHVVRRQERRDVDRHPRELPHGVGVLGPVQSVQDRAARARRGLGRGVDACLQVGHEGGERGAVRARAPFGRHHPRPQLQDDLLEGGGVRNGVGGVQRLERQPGGLRPVVVAAEAVLLQQASSIDCARRRRGPRRSRRARHDEGQHAREQRATDRPNRGSDRHRRGSPDSRRRGSRAGALIRRPWGRARPSGDCSATSSRRGVTVTRRARVSTWRGRECNRQPATEPP